MIVVSCITSDSSWPKSKFTYIYIYIYVYYFLVVLKFLEYSTGKERSRRRTQCCVNSDVFTTEGRKDGSEGHPNVLGEENRDQQNFFSIFYLLSPKIIPMVIK